MQLDRTEIVIRQRTVLELLDLSLVVLKRHFRMIAFCGAIFGLPLLAINIALTHWMLGEDAYLAAEHLDNPEWAMTLRHLLHVLLLAVFQFPLVSLPITLFLGNQIFYSPIDPKRIFQLLKPLIWPMVLALGVMRFALLCLGAELLIDRSLVWTAVESWCFLLVPLVVFFRRAGWPFAPEIIALELCPMRKANKADISYWDRLRGLHRVFVADHIVRWCGAMLFGSLLTCMFVALAIFLKGVTRGQWEWTPAFSQFVLPVALWLVGLYVAVFRFLSYLDSRIRLEGWEIELRLKAEAARMDRSVATAPRQAETDTDRKETVPSS
ncbi:MAG: hypothetical protein AAGG44_05380 [Planctomycetota bacterium]